MKLTNERILVCAGGGFIGGRLVCTFQENGLNVVWSADNKAAK